MNSLQLPRPSHQDRGGAELQNYSLVWRRVQPDQGGWGGIALYAMGHAPEHCTPQRLQ